MRILLYSHKISNFDRIQKYTRINAQNIISLAFYYSTDELIKKKNYIWTFVVERWAHLGSLLCSLSRSLRHFVVIQNNNFLVVSYKNTISLFENRFVGLLFDHKTFSYCGYVFLGHPSKIVSSYILCENFHRLLLLTNKGVVLR